MEKDLIVGIDIGTTSTKAVLYDTKGHGLAYFTRKYPLYQETPDMAEQEPEEIFEAVVEVLTKITQKCTQDSFRITGVAFSSAMHSLIVMDRQNEALTRCITWADNRSNVWSRKLKEQTKLNISERTGTPMHAMTPAAKILWLKMEKPEIFQRAHKFIGIKEYIFFRFFNRYLVDQSIASATGLFNLSYKKWDEEILALLGITADQLSEVVSTTYRISGLEQNLAQTIGLSEKTDFIIGASDGCLSNLGVDALNDATAVITLGTSGAVRMGSNRPVKDKQGRLFCYILDETSWVIGGAVNSGGAIFQWSKELFENERRTSFEEVIECAGSAPAGSEGLIFHPYLLGERAPLWDANARGSYFGLSTRHKKAHFMRSCLEGIVFNLYEVLKLMENMTGVPNKIILTGGMARSDFVGQLFADILQREIQTYDSFESSCLGAMIMGLKAMGMPQEALCAQKRLTVGKLFVPNSKQAKTYQGLYQIYARVGLLLKNEYQEIAAYQRESCLKEDHTELSYDQDPI